jgi:hypothetical protein
LKIQNQATFILEVDGNNIDMIFLDYSILKITTLLKEGRNDYIQQHGQEDSPSITTEDILNEYRPSFLQLILVILQYFIISLLYKYNL